VGNCNILAISFGKTAFNASIILDAQKHLLGLKLCSQTNKSWLPPDLNCPEYILHYMHNYCVQTTITISGYNTWAILVSTRSDSNRAFLFLAHDAHLLQLCNSFNWFLESENCSRRLKCGCSLVEIGTALKY